MTINSWYVYLSDMDLRRALEGRMKLEKKPGFEREQEGVSVEISGKGKVWPGTQMQDTRHWPICPNGPTWMGGQGFLREYLSFSIS